MTSWMSLCSAIGLMCRFEKIYLDTLRSVSVLAAKQADRIAYAAEAPDLTWLSWDQLERNYAQLRSDGKLASSAAHLISPGSTVTFSNDITCTIAEWGIGEGLSGCSMRSRPSPGSMEPLKDGTMSKPLIVTSNMRFNFKARQLAGLIHPAGWPWQSSALPPVVRSTRRLPAWCAMWSTFRIPGT